MIRPQSQKQKKINQFRNSLQKGDKVMTAGGIYGIIKHIDDKKGVVMLAIADGRPETLSLKDIIRHHVDFQHEIATRKYKTLLSKELDKKEIQEGLIKACDVIDLIIEIIRGSKEVKIAKRCLVEGITDGINFKSRISNKPFNSSASILSIKNTLG